MESLPYQNLPQMFSAQAHRYQNRTALLRKKNSQYEPISWNEFKCQVQGVACALQKLGVKRGQRVVILSENRPEWAYTDFGILSLGAVTVPVYATSTAKEVEYVISHAEAQVAFVSNEEQLAKIKPLLNSKSSIRTIIVFDRQNSSELNVLAWNHFCELSQIRAGKFDTEYEQLLKSIQPDDLATLIYTSGTTGPPKGVMLSHRNFLINCLDAKDAIDVNEKDLALSFLPLSHVFERMAGFYFPIMMGASIAYAENMNTVPQNLLEVKPTFACAVPRLYEKIHQRVMEVVQNSSPLKRDLINWAIQTGHETIPYRIKSRLVPLGLKLKYKIADLLVFKKLRGSFGGRLRYFISGGAPLPKVLGEFFYAAGVVICEGYGLTETSPVISVNRYHKLKFGSVGIPFTHVKVRIADDGEILVQGPSVMLGYYQNEEATREVMMDGWFHTGDIGLLDSDGFLVITDRKKDIIATSGGKKVSPQNIENIFKQSQYILQVVLLGDQRRYLVALILPNYEAVAKTLHLEGRSTKELATNAQVVQLIQSEIDKLSVDFASYEKIKYFRLLSEELSQESGELTPTLKVKRKVVSQRYADLIEAMYAEGERRKEG